MWATQMMCLSLQQPSISLRCNSHLFSQPDVMETPHPGTGALDWGTWYRAGIPASQRGPLITKIYLSILNCHTMDLEPARSASPSLLPVLWWLLLYVFSYRTSI